MEKSELLQIPFTFFPNHVTKYQVEIKVNLNEIIKWIFPINLISQSFSSSNSFEFKTESRNTIDKQIMLNLPGILETDFNQEDNYFISMEDIPSDLKKLVQNSINFNSIKSRLTNLNDHLVYNVSFFPMKPFKCNLNFSVNNREGGIWK